MSVWVELDDASLPVDRTLDILGVIVQNMNTSVHNHVGVNFRSADSSLRPPVEELNSLWQVSNSSELFNPGSVDTAAPELYTETKRLKRFVEEQGR